MTAPNNRLQDQVVIVTGSGSGIGRATALAFARVGAHVLAVGRRAEALHKTAAEHPGIAVLPADITGDGAPQAVINAAVDRWGRLDVLVNNAGATAAMPLADTDAQRVTDLFALNVTAPSLLACAALPHLRAGRGAIVNVSSTYGHRPHPSRPPWRPPGGGRLDRPPRRPRRHLDRRTGPHHRRRSGTHLTARSVAPVPGSLTGAPFPDAGQPDLAPPASGPAPRGRP
ncbi:SDR family NAD(P)-dependent oxidoreductase [Streptosporangium canum]|uniref:SDR family NAD(P)-dependent oxidoreductase n=1 Tax=Streptosporangium canum TaxID=324952 RepID=UPI003F4CDCE9